MTSSKSEVTIIKTERRRRWNAHEKRAIVEETYQLGMSVSYVARRHGIAPSMLFYWRRKMEDASLVGVGSEEPVLPQSKVRELEARIKQLERALGRASLDNEILREAVKIGREKKLISRQPLPGIEDLD